LKFRWKLFLTYLVVIAAVVIVVAVSIRSIAVDAVFSHMGGGMEGMGMMGGMTADTQQAVERGVGEALAWGVIAAVLLAGVISYLVSAWVAGTVADMSVAAQQISRGEYAQRVTYGADDEIGDFVNAFNSMAARLDETERIRTELLAMISHELRTPLTNIQGYMEGLIDGVIPEEAETYQLVHGEAARLCRLVTDMETVSRVEAGVEPVRSGALDAEKMARDSVARLRPRFEGKGVTVDLAPGLNVPLVSADEDKLFQVLLNVIGNAIKYTPAGGKVEVSTGVAEEGVIFRVRDTGIGIPSEDLPHIFERFYRVDKSRSAAGGGTGIGLAVARGFVDQMGGRVWAESSPGKGTTVSLVLPTA